MGKAIEEFKKKYPTYNVAPVSSTEGIYNFYIDSVSGLRGLNDEFWKTLKDLNLPCSWVKHFEMIEGRKDIYRVWVLDESKDVDWTDEVKESLSFSTLRGTREGEKVLYRLPETDEAINTAFGHKLTKWYKDNSCSYVILFGAKVDGRSETMPIVIKKRSNPD